MIDYCDPRTVTGPKRHISNVQVIYDGGPDDCAVARLDWDGEPAVLRWRTWSRHSLEWQHQRSTPGHPSELWLPLLVPDPG